MFIGHRIVQASILHPNTVSYKVLCIEPQSVRHVERVVQWSGAEEAAGVKIDTAGTFIVIGGLTGVGLVTARWLLDQGVRHLLLASRSGRAGTNGREPEDYAYITECATRPDVVVVEMADGKADAEESGR